MFKLTHPLPKKYWIACSGGIDSMAALHWLHKPSRADSLVGVVHINHNTGRFAEYAQEYILALCDKLNIYCVSDKIANEPPKGRSKEEYWRDYRYNTFNNLSGDADVVLAHNFDDCLEEYIMCSMIRGYLGSIPYRNGRCIRPFRLWKRQDIERYMLKATLGDYKFGWLEDPSNKNIGFKRNYIRQEIVPQIKRLNPGIYNIVKRAIEAQDERDDR